MSLLELMVASLISSGLVLTMSQSSIQIYQAFEKQQSMSLLQAEGLQALQMMGKAIHEAQPTKNKGATDFRIMAKDSAQMSNTKTTSFQVRKGAASMDGSDAFYTQTNSTDQPYQAFFVQQQGHHQQRDGVLYLQTKNKKGTLQNDALIGHVQSLQIQVGILKNGELQWYEPYEIQERGSKNHAHWQQVKAIKFNLKLQKRQHHLELQKIYALR
jgi:Tfp pilus assembly protein PilW